MAGEQELNQIYPRTLQSLKKERLERMVSEFHRFCRDDLSDTNEISRWFPVFLKAQGAPAELTEICHWEWLHFSCAQLDWGKPKLDPGQVALTPGLQVIHIEKAATQLSIEAGLHVVYACGAGVNTRALTAEQALCLDVLQEDRKFSPHQLQEFLKFEAQAVPTLTKVDWEIVIKELKEAGILILQN